MRRFLVIFTIFALLTGCSAAGERDGVSRQEETVVSQEKTTAEGSRGTAQTPGEGLTMEMEHEVYDPSLSRYTYFVRNATEETVDFGEDYGLQRQENGQWVDLSFGENTGFTAIEYELPPGGTKALTCWLGRLRDTPTEGTYRLVKTVGGQTLYATFELGDSPYTAETPYGFEALEDLSEDYCADTAADTDVIITGDGVKNDGLAEEFLYKVSLDVPCQLRTVQDYDESYPMLIDVIYENGHFLWRMRTGGTVTEQRFSYIVTGGQDLYLSNGADWDSGERYGDRRTFLLPEGTAYSGLVTQVQEMTADRLAGNSTRYKIWSADGAWDACLTDTPTEFSVGNSGWGEVFDLQNWDGLETEITGVQWREDGTLRLTCQTVDGGKSLLTFDPETRQLKG
jgi:hypothetical protein